ncbi:hypothetical protein G6F37_010461 [Rhizopus arrhizus]|nr:hypothetical protein G6F37_010461 [Rhizopus arrhizus]
MSSISDYEDEYMYEDNSEFGNSMSGKENLEGYEHEEDLFAEKQQKKAYEVDYQVLNSDNLKTKQDTEISQVSMILGLSMEDSATLLRYFRWNKEKLFEQYMDSPEKVLQQAGVSSATTNRSFKSAAALDNFVCDICCDDSGEMDTVCISCEHRFCKNCYTQYLYQKIREGESRRIQCPESECTLIVDEKTVELLVDKVTFAKYRELLNRTFVDDNDFLKWCPAPDCEYAVECNIPSTSLTSVVPTVECNCSHRFCFGCTLNDHQPCICALVNKWLKKCEDDSETANWISANTKECPKCHSTIEKNGGCNHMTCRKCKYEFCWVCMGPWSEHGTSWYTCNRFDEKSSAEARDSQTQSRISLERYLHYYNRYANHEHSAKLDQELYRKTEKKMEEMQQTSDLSWIEVQFLKKAVDVTVQCRTTLKWTYAFAFYLAKTNQTELFEDNQRDLEMATEQLSELLEKPLDPDPEKIAKLRQAVLDKTVYVKLRREILLEDTAKGRAVARARGIQSRPFICLVNKNLPSTLVHVTRAFTTQIPQQLEPDLIEISPKKPLKSAVPSQKELVSIMEQCKSTGDVREAIKTVQNAERFGLATVEIYQQLFDLLRTAPFDSEYYAVVAHWFYSDESSVSIPILNNLSIWTNVLRVAFHFGDTHRKEDLRALLEKFSERFDIDKLDQESWQLLIRGWGILGDEERLLACVENVENKVKDKGTFYENALIAFATAGCDEKAKQVLLFLKKENLLSPNVLDRLTRTYAFNGDLELTTHYKNMKDELYPENDDKTMLLIAHKAALGKLVNGLTKRRGPRGLSLQPKELNEVNDLHASWEALTRNMFKNNQLTDVTDCNVILGYLTLANRISPQDYPMEKAEDLFNNYMPEHGIKPNEASHHIMMQGYARSQQYSSKDGRNIRLDKALELVAKAQEDGIKMLNHRTFHALFRACLPHRDGHYYFDNFKLNSLLPSDAYRSFKLDPRVFDIEKIMLEAHLPHDRFTFSTLLTCLAAGKQFKAFNSRWNSFKIHGLFADVALYRHVFALSSLDSEQSKHALNSIKPDMERDITKRRMDFELYCAMLDCCVTAQLPQEAKEIMKNLKIHLNLADEKRKQGKKIERWPNPDDPRVYSALLRTSTSIRGLNPNPTIRAMKERGIEYNQDLWEILLSKYAIDNDHKNLRRLFNKYTMFRFERAGHIPIPVRETSPTIPFPSAPYNRLDVQFINVYLSTLIDSQDISLLFDVLRTWTEQTSELNISRTTLAGVVKLAKQEGALQDLRWLSTELLPKVPRPNKQLKRLEQHVNHFIQK